MRIAFLSIAIGLFLTPAASATDPDPKAAVQRHMECVIANAARADDGRMEAASLAKLVQPLCFAEHEAAMLASSPHSWKKTPEPRARELEFMHTLAAVDLYRDLAKRRAR